MLVCVISPRLETSAGIGLQGHLTFGELWILPCLTPLTELLPLLPSACPRPLARHLPKDGRRRSRRREHLLPLGTDEPRARRALEAIYTAAE